MCGGLTLLCARAAERIFIWGAKTKTGTIMSNKGTNGAHVDNITNALRKQHCRHNFSFYIISTLFIKLGTELTPPPLKKMIIIK